MLVARKRPGRILVGFSRNSSGSLAYTGGAKYYHVSIAYIRPMRKALPLRDLRIASIAKARSRSA